MFRFKYSFLFFMLILLCFQVFETLGQSCTTPHQVIRVAIFSQFPVHQFLLTSLKKKGSFIGNCIELRAIAINREADNQVDYSQYPFVFTLVAGMFRLEGHFRKDFSAIMAIGRAPLYVLGKHRSVSWSDIRQIYMLDNVTESILEPYSGEILGNEYGLDNLFGGNRKVAYGAGYQFIPRNAENAAIMSYRTYLHLLFWKKTVFHSFGYDSFDAYPIFHLNQTLDTPLSRMMRPMLFVNHTWLQEHYEMRSNITQYIVEMIIEGSVICRDEPQNCETTLWSPGPFETNLTNFISWPSINGFGYFDERDLKVSEEEFHHLFARRSYSEFNMTFLPSFIQEAHAKMLNNSIDIFGANHSFHGDLRYFLDPCVYPHETTKNPGFHYELCITTFFERRIHIYFSFTVGYLILFFFSMIQTGILFFNRKKQPIMSRAMAAILGCMSISIFSLVAAIWCIIYLENETNPYHTYFNTPVGSNLLVLSPLYFPFIGSTCAYIFYFLQLLRYFYIRFIYEKMQSAHSNKSGNMQDFSKTFKNHRFLMSNKVYFISSSAAVIFLLLLQIPATLRFIFGHPLFVVFISVIFTIIIRALMAFVFLFVLIVDILKNWRSIFKERVLRIQWFFLFDDPTYFRLEALLDFFGSVLLQIALALVISYVVFPTYEALNILQLIQFLVLCTQLFIQCGGMVLIIQFRNKLAVRNSRASQEKITSEVEKLLDDTHGMQIFENFAKNEFSSENVIFYKELVPFVREIDGMKKKSINREYFHEIYNSFVKKDAMLQVNLPHHVVSSVESYLKKNEENSSVVMHSSPKNSNSPEIDDDIGKILLEVYEQLIINLADTHSRLTLTNEYKKHEVLKKGFKDEMLKNISVPSL